MVAKAGWLGLCILLGAASYSHCASAIVNSDLVNVRSGPSAKSSIIGRLNSGTIIDIETIEGSQDYLAGIWDSWIKIKGDREQWINAFYVTVFPFILVPKEYEINVYNELSAWPEEVRKMPVHMGEYQIAEAFVIVNPLNSVKTTFFRINDGWQFVLPSDCEWKDSQLQRKMDILDNPIEDEFLDTIRVRASFGPILGTSKERVDVSDGHFYREIVEYANIKIESIYFGEQTDAFPARIKINHKCEYIKYGLNPGISASIISEVIGPPDKMDDNEYFYRAIMSGKENSLKFEIRDGLIVSIVWDSSSTV